MRLLHLAAALYVAFFAFPAMAQEPSASAVPEELRQASPPYTLHLRHLTSNETLRFREGDVRVQQGVLRSGDTIVSIPVRHRRTVVLTERLLGEGLLGPRLSLPAGTQGYHADRAAAVMVAGGLVTSYRGELGPMWCFLTNDPGERFRSRCLFQGNIADCDDNALVPVGCVVTLPQASLPEPQVEDRPISFTDDLRVEYVLRPWSRQRATLEMTLNGKRVMMQYGDWDAEGAVDFLTAVGHVRLARNGNRRSEARITVTPYNDAELAEFDAQPLQNVIWLN